MLLEQSNVQRVWFGTAVPISFTVIPGKSASVHTLTCLRWGKHLLSVSQVVAWSGLVVYQQASLSSVPKVIYNGISSIS